MVAVLAGIATRSLTPTSAQRITHTFGQSTLVLRMYEPTPEAIASVDAHLAAEVPDSSVATVTTAWGRGSALIAANLADPLLEGVYLILDGGAPTREEVALGWGTARTTGLGVGDTWSPTDSQEEFRISAIVYQPEVGGGHAVFVHPASFERLRGLSPSIADASQHQWYVGADDDARPLAQSIAANWPDQEVNGADPLEPGLSPGIEATVRWWWENDPFPDEQLEPGLWSTLVSAAILVEVALLAAAAYASGIRRRLREIGLVSTQGATRGQIRGSVVAEAGTVAAVAWLVGSGLAIAIAHIGRPIVQQHWQPTLDSVQIGLLDVAGPLLVAAMAAVAAAWIPARTASRLSVLAALQGRMPVRTLPRWLLPLSVGCIAAGLFLLGVALTASGGAGRNIQGTVAFGLVLTGGVVAGAPLVAGWGRLASHLPTRWRLPMRDAARHAVRATAAIAALMVIFVAAVGAATALQTNSARGDATGNSWTGPDERFVHVRGGFEERFFDSQSATRPVPSPVSSADMSTVTRILPRAEPYDLGTLGLVPITSSLVSRQRSEGSTYWDRITCITSGSVETCRPVDAVVLEPAIADPAMLRAMGLTEAARDLERGEVVVLGNRNGTLDVDVDGEQVVASVHDTDVRALSMPILLVNEAWAQQRGLDPSSRSVLLVNDDALTSQERSDLYASEVNVSLGAPGGITATQTMIGLVVGAAAIAVVVIAIIVGLAATEADRDIATMVAVGAEPRSRREFLGHQSALYTLSAAVIATPIGLLITWVISADNIDIGPLGVWTGGIAVPVLPISALVVVVPVAIGLGTALIVRSSPARPPRRGA